MATTNFYLQPKNKEGFSQVILVYQDKGKKFKFSTKIKVKKSYWGNGKLIKGKVSEVNEVNSLLNGYRADIEEILREGMFNKKEYSVTVVKRKFKMKSGQISAGNEFYRIYEEFMEASKATKAQGTIRK